MKQEQINTLEQLIDLTSVAQVLEAIVQVCYEKEQHINDNWQDTTTAGIWREAGRLVSKAQDKVGC